MVKPASFDKNGMKSGVWSEEEDNKLRNCINQFGHPNWRLLPLVAGLKRCGKSCRLRWVNYLKPGLRRGKFTKDEERLIIELHNQLGNKWSAITEYFPGRTDNDIKNYWHAHIQKRGGGVSRAVRIRNLAPEEQSSDSINSSITTSGVNQETPPAASGVAFNGNMGVFESNADSYYNAAALYDQTCFNNLDNIDYQNNIVNEGEFDGFGENMLPTLCDIDSSHWGINASWNNLMSDATILPQPDIWSTEPVGEDFFNNIQFW